MFKIFKYFQIEQWQQAGICLIFTMAQVWLDLKIPDYMAVITRLVQTPGNEVGLIWQIGGLMLLCALGSLVSAFVVGFFAARMAASFAMGLRSELFNKVESFSMEEINRFSIASLITRSTNDITQIQMFISIGLQMIIKSPILAAWATTKIIGKGYAWSLATGVAIMILVVLVALALIFVMPKFKKMQALTDDLNRVTRENLMGLRVVRAYNAQDYQSEKFETANKGLTDVQLFTSRAMAMLLPVINSIMAGLSLAIYWIGAHLIGNAPAQERVLLFSNMIVFSSYAMQIIMAFMFLAGIFVMFPRAGVSAKRIGEVLQTQAVIKEGGLTDGLPGEKGEVTFKHVSFKYPGSDEYILHDINFTAKQGETVAFIGSTGSGKTTLLHLLLRFFDATEGEILVDGVNIKEYKLEALYDKIGYVPQKAVIFKGTVSSNVAFGSNNLLGIKRAVNLSQSTDFVEKMDGAYDAQIAQDGANISGGQKQRLAIARAICRKPEIYLFDDSFSALDYKTDHALRSALKKETAGVTSLIVAQRIGTIMDADQIIVLEEGRVVGTGKHRDLLRDCEVYQEIAGSQLSGEELIS